MIYLLYGTDESKVREKLHHLLPSLFKKRPDASYFHITNEDAVSMDELIDSQGLFEQKYIVVYDHVLTSAEEKKQYVKELKRLRDAPHLFIFLEGKLDAKTITSFTKYAEKVQAFDGKQISKDSFNIFSLADAFGTRDRKALWMLYREARERQISNEEIHGILWWQAKSMECALLAKSAREAGLNPFVFQKSNRFLKKFTKEELHKLSSQLIHMSHRAHRGLVDFDTALEQFVLRV